MRPPPTIAAGSGTEADRWAWWEVLAGLAVSLVPCGLLLEPGANFYYDWHNHQWLVGYWGEHLRAHLRLPEVLNAAGAIAMPQPVFYGFLLYPCLGLLSALLGASLALRVGIALTFAAQFCAVYFAGRSSRTPRGVSLVVAAAVTWSVHSLTNLYNRAALTEFFAVAFFNIAVAAGVAALAPTATARGRLTCGWLAIVFAVLTVGSHPPTALVGAGLIAMLVPLAIREFRRSGGKDHGAFRRVVVGVGLGAVVVAPWVYANLHFRADLGIVGKYTDFSFSLDHIDAVGARFSPVPPDVFRAAPGPAYVGTPYVEAPLHFALLLVVGWNFLLLQRAGGSWRGASRAEQSAAWLAGVGGAWFVGTLLLSLSPGLANAFRWLAPYVQFGTRFVSQANLGLLLVVLATGFLVAARGGYGRHRRGTGVLVAVSLAIALVAVVIKLKHGAAVRERGGEPQYAWRGERAALITAGRTDAAGDYAVVKKLPQLTPKTVETAHQVALPVGREGEAFGRVGAARIELAAPGWVITNVVAFPWSIVTVDGREVPVERRAAHEHRLALNLPAGPHVIEWQWRPESAWRWLNIASRWGFVALLAGAAYLAVRAPKRDRSAVTLPGDE